MRKIISLFLLLTIIGLSGCVRDSKPSTTKPINTALTTEIPVPASKEPTESIVGNDRDEHNCIGSAGYIWCDAKQKCLRVWEEPCVNPEVNLEILKTAISDQIIAKRGQGAKSLIISVHKVEGNYAQGGAKPANEDAGGGMWFAAMVNDNWTLVWDGNGMVSCADLKPYMQFPSDMIPECYDETTQQLINR